MTIGCLRLFCRTYGSSRFFRAGLLCLLTTLPSLQAAAQPSPPQLNQIPRQTDQIIREERLRQERILEEQNARRRPPGTVDLGIEPLPPAEGESAQCFPVKDIVLEGAHSLDEGEHEALVAPFVGKCIGIAEIRELLRVITNHYIEKGYVTTRAYIPQQDLGSGVLKLLVVEGITGSIELDGEQAGVNLATAFPGLEGELLNIRDIEQGLDQVNRLQSNSATMELLPGDVPGRTRILIRNEPGRRLNGSFSVDNQGSESQGEYRGTATVSLDNPLGINDFWFLSLLHNIDDDSGNGLSRSLLGSFTIPYGYWTFSGSHSQFNYESLIRSATQSFNSDGETRTSNLGVARVLDRGQTYKLTLAAGLTHENTQNFIAGSLLTTSSRRLTVANLNLTGVFAALGGSWAVDGGLSRGLDAFGVEELPGAGSGTVPTVEFWKANLSASYARPFKLGETSASWSSSLQGQFSRDYLPGSQQISVGGLYTVRGYDGISLAGDRGVYWRNDVAVTLGLPANRWLGAVQPYVALDAGHIFGREGQPEGTLVGKAVGLRGFGGRLSFDIAYGTPVDYSDRVGSLFRIEDHVWYLAVGMSI